MHLDIEKGSAGMNTTGMLIPQLGLTMGGAGIWTLVGVVVLALIRARPALAKLRNESDASLRTDLIARLDKADAKIQSLEAAASAERQECDRRIRSLHAKLEGITRQFLQYQMAVGQAIPPTGKSAHIEEMLRHLGDVVRDEDERKRGKNGDNEE